MPQAAIMPIIGGISAAASLGGTIASLAKDKPKQFSQGIDLSAPSLHDNAMTLQAPALNDPNMQPLNMQQQQPQMYPPMASNQPNLGNFYNQINSGVYPTTGLGEQYSQGVF